MTETLEIISCMVFLTEVFLKKSFTNSKIINFLFECTTTLSLRLFLLSKTKTGQRVLAGGLK